LKFPIETQFFKLLCVAGTDCRSGEDDTRHHFNESSLPVLYIAFVYTRV